MSSRSVSSRKPYVKPVIVYEARLEAQAGSPIGSPVELLEDLTLPK
ncbi:MAG: hypothetical protein NZ528_12765 [Caldilineales bacterium]|nr:hypothetical protein [Caldilineales bacterium]MDW8317289.1 hypothetical protein [Anaerolineae bacterium]